MKIAFYIGAVCFCVIFLFCALLPRTGSAAEIKDEGNAIVSAQFAQCTIFKTPGFGVIYGYDEAKGFVVSLDAGETWEARNTGLPRKIVYPFRDSNTIRKITSIAVDPLAPERVAITTEQSIFLSIDYGVSWLKIKTQSPVSTSDYFMAVAIDPLHPASLLLGTSFSGLYETRDAGETWQDLSDVSMPFYQGAAFYQEIAALSYSPENPQVLYLATSFGREVYKTADRKTYEMMDFPGSRGQERITGMQVRPLPSNRGVGIYDIKLEIETDQSYWLYDLEKKDWTTHPKPMEWKHQAAGASVAKIIRLAQARDKKGIYVSSWHAGAEKYLNIHINYIKQHHLNAMVVDFKESFGTVYYNSRLPALAKVGALGDRIDVAQLVEKLHRQKIYLIARIVVFRDKALFRYNNNEYAVWDKTSDAPWTNAAGESWVDPYAEFVWNYNIDIAAELQSLGVDEIQFDYIRFPSDGRTRDIKYRYRRADQTRSEALESFIKMARERITIPISVDIYGFNAWYQMGNWIGQNISMFSQYVDAISPMFYPSHFSRNFLARMDYLERARYIYQVGSNRASFFAGKGCYIRPYVQAFLLGNELNFSADEVDIYMKNQLAGIASSQASGFLFWNAANDYGILNNALSGLK